ncbi:MAG: UPF0236 family protein [bacterium]|nr:UPF0236 family protein [bacterium]
MPTVETTVTISVPDEGLTLEALEAAIAGALGQAGRQLLVAACQAMDDAASRAASSRAQRHKPRGSHLLTRFGWVRLMRWQVRDPATGRYACPLDSILGLWPHQHVSPWVRDQAVAFATRVTYRQAAHLLGALLDVPLDHRTLFRWVQQAGATIVACEDAQQTAVFADGDLPVSDPTPREIIVAEVDGTFLHAQHEDMPNFEVRLGVLASGKALESLTAKHRRYRLQERLCYAGVEPAQAFGERLFLAGERHLGLSRAHHLLLIGDGADWIEALAGHQRWKATYHLDWWHLRRAITEAFPGQPRMIRRLLHYLHTGRGGRLPALIRAAKVAGGGDPQRLNDLLGYVQSNMHGFYGADHLRPRLSPQARLVAVHGSGAVEKHIELVIGRRFKGRGMRWTRAGANRLLKLRLRQLQPHA